MSSPTPPGQPPHITFTSPTPEPEGGSEINEIPSDQSTGTFRTRSTQLQSKSKPSRYLKESESGQSSESEGHASNGDLSDRELSGAEVTEPKVPRRKARRDRRSRQQAGSTTMFEGQMLVDDIRRLPNTRSLNTPIPSDVSSEEDVDLSYQEHMTEDDITCLIQGISSTGSVEADAISCNSLLRMCTQLKSDTEALRKMGSIIEKGLKSDPKWKDLPNKELLLRQITKLRNFCKENILEQQKLIKSAAKNGYNFLIPAKKTSTSSLTDFTGKTLRIPKSPEQESTEDVSYSYSLLTSSFAALMQMAWNWKVEWLSCEYVANFTETVLPDDFRSTVDLLIPPKESPFIELFHELLEVYKLAERVSFVAPKFGELGNSPRPKMEQSPQGEQSSELERFRAKPSLDFILGSVSTTSHRLAPLPIDYLYAHGFENRTGGTPTKIYNKLLDDRIAEAQEIKRKAKAILTGLSHQSATYEDINLKTQKTVPDAQKMLAIGRQLQKKWYATTPSMQRVYTELMNDR